ncbi:MAG: class I SAM-dependent methyltransferase [Candidatus Paceibacterota bacterium]|jgi:SAM-dependent methyltransferase
MPNEGFPNGAKKVELSPKEEKQLRSKIEKRNGSVSDSMITDQGRFYDARAGIYDSQNEMPERAERLKEIDEYFARKLKGLLKPGGLTYLDFGCATGTHTEQFISHLTNNNIEKGYGVDISGEMVKIATQTLPEFSITQGGAEKINFNEKFDLMTSFYHALGHLTEAELELFFQNASRSLKPGGILCFDVIKDIGHIRTMLLNRKLQKKGKGKYVTYYSKLPDGSFVKGNNDQPIIGSVRMFSEKEIANLAKENNFEVVEINTLHFFEELFEEFTVILKKQI